MARIDPGRLLAACFGNDDEGRRALETCESSGGLETDAAVGRLLPLLYRRWGASTRSSLIDLAHRAYLATWQRNRERMASIGSTLDVLERAGVECMLLKGAALTLRHYRDYGVRSMADFDLLIHPGDIEPAVRALMRDGWKADEGCTVDAVVRQSRVRHAWQFLRGETDNCDLHWRPIARCYSPRIAEMFWQGAETVQLNHRAVKLPGPTDQLFHVCVHAMHWEWMPNLHWMADALTVLGDSEIDWQRAAALAAASRMQVQFGAALTVLASQCDAAIPELPAHPDTPEWERREYRLLQKRCPLGFLDSVTWHVYNFRRIRPFDAQWRAAPAWVGFPRYLAAFLDAADRRSLPAKLWAEIGVRVRERRKTAS